MAVFTNDELQVLRNVTDYFRLEGIPIAAEQCSKLAKKIHDHLSEEEHRRDQVRGKFYMRAELVKFRIKHDPEHREFHEGMYQAYLSAAYVLGDRELLAGLEAIKAREKEICVVYEDPSDPAPYCQV